MARKPKPPAGIEEFEELARGLAAVPKDQLDREVKKYEKRKAAKRAKAKPRGRGR